MICSWQRREFGARRVPPHGIEAGVSEKPELNFSKNRAENDDVLGDAYEYLMRHFATESGKSTFAAAFQSATLMHSTATGKSSPACAPSCSKKPTAPAIAS